MMGIFEKMVGVVAYLAATWVLCNGLALPWSRDDVSAMELNDTWMLQRNCYVGVLVLIVAAAAAGLIRELATKADFKKHARVDHQEEERWKLTDSLLVAGQRMAASETLARMRNPKGHLRLVDAPDAFEDHEPYLVLVPQFRRRAR
ncbi:MAG: hypothetical protein WCO52_03990 [bacterium]